MPYLCRAQVNTASTLALHAVDATGHLYDPTTVEFRVVDITTGLQVFPVAGYEDVTEDGRTDKGVFYAYDSGTLAGWAPDVAATVGAHRIDWRFTDADDESVTRTWSQKFDVYTAGFEIGYWTYLTPNRVRAEGVSAATLTDARMIMLIERAQAFIEQECRQPFRPIRHTLQFDGNGGTTFHCPIPIIGVDEFLLNNQSTALGTDNYEVYFSTTLGADPGWRPKDNRKNPKVKLSGEFPGSVFDPGGMYGTRLGASRFAPSAKGHSLKAVWGFVEPDGTTPALITDAMLRVVLATAMTMDVGTGGSSHAVSGPVTMEKTDQHEIHYAFSYTAGSLDAPLATSPEVLDIVRRYRAPLGIASPATTWAGLRA